MMKLILFVFVCIVGVTNSFGGGRSDLPRLTELPDDAKYKISKDNNTPLKNIHFLPKGTVEFKGVYVSALVFEGKVRNCVIYTYAGEGVYDSFGEPSCEFEGGAQIDSSRDAAMPDVFYRIKIFSTRLGATVNDVVAFYFDPQKETYCESRSLAVWLASGNRLLKPDIKDGVCASK